MVILREPVSIQMIRQKYHHFFRTMVKIVVDVKKELVALDAELHADLEALLLQHGSNQKDLWGANIYFDKPRAVEFTALINIRPAQNNKSMEVQDPKIRAKIKKIVHYFITS